MAKTSKHLVTENQVEAALKLEDKNREKITETSNVWFKKGNCWLYLRFYYIVLTI